MDETGVPGNCGQKDPNAFDEKCFKPRTALRGIADEIKALMGHAIFMSSGDSNADFGEMKANIMLAYRHVEDARMRLGKAVQAFDGGTSCYPR